MSASVGYWKPQLGSRPPGPVSGCKRKCWQSWSGFLFRLIGLRQSRPDATRREVALSRGEVDCGKAENWWQPSGGTDFLIARTGGEFNVPIKRPCGVSGKFVNRGDQLIGQKTQRGCDDDSERKRTNLGDLTWLSSPGRCGYDLMVPGSNAKTTRRTAYRKARGATALSWQNINHVQRDFKRPN